MDYVYSQEFHEKFRKFVNLFMKVNYHINIDGLDNIITDDNYILSGNHLHILDSWLVSYAIQDNLRFMVDNKLYKTHFGNWFFKRVGTYGINPDEIDLNAVRKTVELLKAGEKVVIFPEGHTHKMNEYLPFKPGVPRMAVMAAKKVIPFGINGRYFPGSTLNISFGEAIDFKSLDLPRDKWDDYLEENVRKLELKKF